MTIRCMGKNCSRPALYAPRLSIPYGKDAEIQATINLKLCAGCFDRLSAGELIDERAKKRYIFGLPSNGPMPDFDRADLEAIRIFSEEFQQIEAKIKERAVLH